MTTYQEIHGIRYKMYATCIDAEAPNYKACISACHVGSKQLITYQDVLEKGGNLSEAKAKCKGAVTIQRTAPTMEQALDYAEQDIPRLTEIIAPVIRTSSTSTATFGAEFERLIPAVFPPDTKNGRNQTSYLRRHIKPILQEYRMDEIDNALVLDTVKKLLAEETKEKYRIEVRNRHLESIRKFLKECKPYLPHVKNIDYELEGLRSISKSRAKTTNALQGHFSNEERTALLRWCVENLESIGGRAIILVYNFYDLNQICALDREDFECVSDSDINACWVQNRMGKNDTKYTKKPITAMQQIRRLPMFALTAKIMEKYDATLERQPEPGKKHPLLAGGTSGTIRIAPEKAMEEIARVMRGIGVQCKIIPGGNPDTAETLLSLLKKDTLYCAEHIMNLRDNEAKLIPGRIQSNVNARCYWDPDCDDTVIKLYRASVRMFDCIATSPTWHHTENQYRLDETGHLALTLPAGQGRYTLHPAGAVSLDMYAPSGFWAKKEE